MARREGKIARRYAKALFNLSVPAQIDTITDALKEFAEIWSSQPELRSVVLNPGVPEQQRLSVMSDVCARLKTPSENFTSFVHILLQNRRIDDIQQILEAYEKIVAEFKRMLSLEITSAFELADEEKQKISGQIRNRIPENYAALISTQWKIDKQLIGGLVIRSGDHVFDGSLNGALERLGKQLRL